MLNKTLLKTKQSIILYSLKKAVKSKHLRKILISQINKRLYNLIIGNAKNELKAVQIKKYEWMKGLIKRFFINLDKGYLSSHAAIKAVEVLGLNNFLRDKVSKVKMAKTDFKKRYNYKNDPPSFILISPTQVCNLRCEGCYAASSPESGVTMPFDVLDRILKENHDIFGNRFVVISGGEPLMYRSQKKTLFDIFEKYNDTFFIFYTNGTLITKEIAERLSKCGNAYPQISAEGMEKETDERRGSGVFKKVLQAMSYLRKYGVPFSLSIVPTTKNIDILLDDDFYDFWFEKQGIVYMWQFQFMPIGRGKEVFNLMPTPEQRFKLYRQWEKSLKKGYPIADFWNSGVLSSGCLAFGRPNGYLYIDWNGNIMPCVFVPYYVDNIYDLYKNGKTLADAFFSDFFKKGRKWQREYGYADRCADRKKFKNGLMPCPIRDNYKYFRENILPKNAKSEDKFAEAARNSEEYYNKLVEYDEKVKRITQPIWEKEYKEN